MERADLVVSVSPYLACLHFSVSPLLRVLLVMNLLELHNLSIRFRTENGTVDAVKNVSLSMKEGDSLAIVGESGSGKSVTALSLTRLLPAPPAEYAGGKILFLGQDILKMLPREIRLLRGGGVISFSHTVGGQQRDAVDDDRFIFAGHIFERGGQAVYDFQRVPAGRARLPVCANALPHLIVQRLGRGAEKRPAAPFSG